MDSKKFNPFIKQTPPTSTNAPSTSASTSQQQAFAPKSSVFNPFTASPSTASSSTNGSKQQQQQRVEAIIGREATRAALKRQEAAQRTDEYKRFISFQDENKEIMKRSSPRQMMHDNTRPVHKLWRASIVLMLAGMVAQYYTNKSRPELYDMMAITKDGLALSMLDSNQLEQLGGGYISQDPEFKPRAPYELKEDLVETNKKLMNPAFVYRTEHPDVPCFPLVINFKQCMGYITENAGMQPIRKVDQCWIPLQRANMCMLQHRLQPMTPENMDLNNINLIEVNHSYYDYEAL